MRLSSDLKLTVGPAMTDKESSVGVSEKIIEWQPVQPQHVLGPFALGRRNFTSVPIMDCTLLTNTSEYLRHTKGQRKL